MGDTESATITVPLVERDLAALDARLFTGPFVLVGADNRGRGVVTTAQRARDALSERTDVATVAGTLRQGVWAVDVDPADAGASPWLGDRICEQLAAWCGEHRLPWLVRESGRPGGRHVVIALPAGDRLVHELRRTCRRLAGQHGVGLTMRRTLRLLTAPHRLGLPAPVVAGTLRPRHLPPADDDRPAVDQRERRRDRVARRARERRHAAEHQAPPTGPAGPADRSPSGREFGRACYLVRVGASSARAWAETTSCQVADRGEQDWRRYLWMPAVTAVAAEQGVDEAEAWARAQAASRDRCRQLGRDGWRAQCWEPALAEAATDRPRRWTDPDTPPDQRVHRPRSEAEKEEQRRELEAHQAGLRAAAEHHLRLTGRRPQVHTTMLALMDTMAEAIVLGGGKIGRRRIGEESALGDSTTKRRRREALDAGLLYRVATYRDDAQPCDIYGVGPAAQAFVEAARQTGPRSCTPPLRALGSADPAHLHARHQAERADFRSAPSMTSADTETLEKAYPDRKHPVPTVIRSRVRQLTWWESLSDEEREQRRAACRARLDALPADDRHRWTTEWLPRRDNIDASIRAILAGTAAAADHATVAAAPMTVHHGRRDPNWRTGGTPTQPPDPPPQRPVQAELALNN